MSTSTSTDTSCGRCQRPLRLYSRPALTASDGSSGYYTVGLQVLSIRAEGPRQPHISLARLCDGIPLSIHMSRIDRPPSTARGDPPSGGFCQFHSRQRNIGRSGSHFQLGCPCQAMPPAGRLAEEWSYPMRWKSLEAPCIQRVPGIACLEKTWTKGHANSQRC